jgi:hypothetical protein
LPALAFAAEINAVKLAGRLFFNISNIFSDRLRYRIFIYIFTKTVRRIKPVNELLVTPARITTPAADYYGSGIIPWGQIIQVFNSRPISTPTINVMEDHFFMTLYTSFISRPYFL